jgi:hypothetical protein
MDNILAVLDWKFKEVKAKVASNSAITDLVK